MRVVVLALTAVLGAAAQEAKPTYCYGPLRHEQLVTLLRGGLPPHRIKLFIETCKIQFAVTDEIVTNLKEIGAQESVIQAIAEQTPVTVVLHSDEDGSLQVDRYSGFEITANTPLRIRLSPGDHAFAAHAKRSTTEWRQRVRLPAGGMVQVQITLAQPPEPEIPESRASRFSLPSETTQVTSPTPVAKPEPNPQSSKAERVHVPDKKAMGKYKAAERALKTKYLGEADIQRAQADFEEATKLDPMFAEAWVGRAKAHLAWWSRHATGELLTDALEFCERALALNPELAAAWNTRGVARELVRRRFYDLQEKQRLEALADYTEAVRLNPNWDVARCNRARLLLKVHKREALQEAEAAVRLNPQSAEAYEVLADALRAIGERNRAIAADKVRLELRSHRRAMDAQLW